MKKLTAVISIIMVALFSFGVFSSAAKTESDTEYQEIQSLIEENRFSYATMLKSLNNTIDVGQTEKKLSAETALRIYKLKPDVYLFSDEYEKNGYTFEPLISDDYSWIVPLYEENVYIEFCKGKNGWEFSSAGSALFDDDMIGLTMDSEGINKLHRRSTTVNAPDVEDLKIVSLGFNGYVAFFHFTGEERLLPLMFTEKDSKIINTYEYYPSEFIEAYEKDYPVVEVTVKPWEKPDIERAGGQIGSVRIVYDYTIVYVLVALIVVIVAAVVVAVLIAKKKKR